MNSLLLWNHTVKRSFGGLRQRSNVRERSVFHRLRRFARPGLRPVGLVRAVAACNHGKHRIGCAILKITRAALARALAVSEKQTAQLPIRGHRSRFAGPSWDSLWSQSVEARSLRYDCPPQLTAAASSTALLSSVVPVLVEPLAVMLQLDAVLLDLPYFAFPLISASALSLASIAASSSGAATIPDACRWRNSESWANWVRSRPVPPAVSPPISRAIRG